MSAYADDLSGVFTNQTDAQKMVDIGEWFAQWSDMTLNHRKCVVSSWCQKKNCHFSTKILVGGFPIAESPEGGPIKILGFWLAPSLNWKRQTEEAMRRRERLRRPF